MHAIKVDVDTLAGLQRGVPTILNLLADYDVKVTFFVSMGPDNSGKHIGRIFRKDFLIRMAKMNPIKMIGFKNMLYGTVLKARLIGKDNRRILERIVEEGHELGIHGWNHYEWQRKLHQMDKEKIREHMRLSVESYSQIIGCKPYSSAAPGWNTTRLSLDVQEEFDFLYASDVRGIHPFYPKMDGQVFKTLQIPTTAPTIDELMVSGFSLRQAVEFLEERWRRDNPFVWAVHAEIEGISMTSEFERLLGWAVEHGIRFERLDSIAVRLRQTPASIPKSAIEKVKVKGLDGLFSRQKVGSRD